MHFSLMWNPFTKIKSFWITWQRRVKTLVKKSGSWFERNGGYKWLFVFLCLVSDHVKTSSQRWRVWGEEQGRARGRPGKRKCAEVCGFRGEAAGRETSLLMWLLCPLPLYFSCPTLARLSLILFVPGKSWQRLDFDTVLMNNRNILWMFWVGNFFQPSSSWIG